jgi:hypothetical protein
LAGLWSEGIEVNWRKYRKLLVFIVTALGDAVTLGLIPEAYQPLALAFITVAGGYGIYRVENAR